MQDDEDQFDDFDDLGDFDDLDDLGDDVSLGHDSSDEGFVDGGDDFSDEDFAGDAFTEDLDEEDFDEILGDDEEDEADAINPALVSQDKEGFLSKFTFNQIVIGITLIVGLGVFGYQVVTKKPPPQQENFQSAVSMSGASDNVVYNQNDNKIEQAQAGAENQALGLLNNPESLDSLEIEFDSEDTSVPVPIAPEEINNDEKILLNKDLGNDFSEFQNEFSNDAYEQNVMISPEFDTSDLPSSVKPKEQAETVMQESEATTMTGLGTEITKALPLKRGAQDEVSQNEAAQSSENSQILEAAESSLGLNIDSILDDEDPLPMPGEVPTSNAVGRNIVDTQKAQQTVEKVLETEEAAVMLAPLKEEISEKDKKIANLQSKVSDLEKEIETLKAAKMKSMEPKKAVKKSAPKKKTTSKPSSTKNMWELRAAQPGKAWVAQKGRDDLQPVVVGDILSGIGRIKNISYLDNRWVVTGSEGEIKQ
ncbi:MAG: hypothetical protein AAF244_02705 [Pseudomonadota bacterium]